MRAFLLRNLLLADAAILLVLGACLVVLPKQVERTFQFRDLPVGVEYIMGLWGCGLAAMSVGYFAAARNPIRHVVWIQVGIARGAAEVLLGCLCIAREIVTFRQAAFGLAAAALMSLGYLVLYPRKPRLIKTGTVAAPTEPV